MSEIERFKSEIEKSMPILKDRYKVKTIGIFGSYVKGEQKKKSDVDVLVEFDEVPGLLTFLEIENYLSDILNIKVDLVMKDALKPVIGKHILKEVINI
jgi:hypothetical protein